jgi:hypothetical protein
VVLVNASRCQGIEKMKRPIGLKVLLIGSYFLLPSVASADCDLSAYDRTSPKAISSGLDNGIVNFQWSSDVDTVEGYVWIWHYIKNFDRHGLGYKWPKAGLRRALGSPLEPGKTDCNRYFVTTQIAPDDNAPITYGTNDTPQRAAVYLESKTPQTGEGTSAGAGSSSEPSPATGTVIETSYMTGAGSSQNVGVTVHTRMSDGQWTLQISRTPNVIIAMAAKFLSGEQLGSLLSQISNQKARVSAGPLSKTIEREDRDVLSKLFSESEITERADQPYIILFRCQRDLHAQL